MLALMFKAQLLLARGQALLSSGAEEGSPSGKSKWQVVAYVDLNN